MSTNNTNPSWSPKSWRSFKISQQPIYDNNISLDEVENSLASLPPLVNFDEIDRLSIKLKEVAEGKGFILQGGDCAESFSSCNEQNLKNYVRLFLQMNAVLMDSFRIPIVKIGRIAGQYAKPRSSDTEFVEGIEYPSYRGDIANGIELDAQIRKPDPSRMIEAYFRSAAVLNYIRSLTSSGFASLKNISKWNNDFLQNLPEGTSQEILNGFQETCSSIDKKLGFVETCSSLTSDISRADFYTSHEALLLNYEEPFVRKNPQTGKYYLLSAHTVWIGDRTRKLDQAHVEFLSGIENPVGIKVGPTTNIPELIEILDKVNPKNEKGRVILVVRMGNKLINELFPPILSEVVKSGRNVIWQSDPMHGNVEKSPSGYKTRYFNNILHEFKSFVEICKSHDVHPGGIHLEMTGNNVTECTGGVQNISDLDLNKSYHTHCDPRLNSVQALQLMFEVANDI